MIQRKVTYSFIIYKYYNYILVETGTLDVFRTSKRRLTNFSGRFFVLFWAFFLRKICPEKSENHEIEIDKTSLRRSIFRLVNVLVTIMQPRFFFLDV